MWSSNSFTPPQVTAAAQTCSQLQCTSLATHWACPIRPLIRPSWGPTTRGLWETFSTSSWNWMTSWPSNSCMVSNQMDWLRSIVHIHLSLLQHVLICGGFQVCWYVCLIWNRHFSWTQLNSVKLTRMFAVVNAFAVLHLLYSSKTVPQWKMLPSR